MNKNTNPILIKVRTNMINNIKKSNIPLPQLAKTVGVSVQTLKNFINGKTAIIRTSFTIKISRALNMTLEQFIGMKDL